VVDDKVKGAHGRRAQGLSRARHTACGRCRYFEPSANRARFATSPLRWPGPQRHLHGAPDQAGSFARRSAFRVPHQPSVPVGFRSVSGIAAAEAAATAIKVFSFMVVGLCPSRLYPLSCWILRPTTGLLKGRSSPVLNKWLVRSRALGRQLSMNLFICAQHERSKMSLLAAMLPWVSKTRLCGGAAAVGPCGFVAQKPTRGSRHVTKSFPPAAEKSHFKQYVTLA